jgi:hypothetical protein
MPIVPIIDGVSSSGYFIKIQDWQYGTNDYKKFWNFVTSAWTSGESSATSAVLSTAEVASGYSLSVDLSGTSAVSGSSLTKIRTTFYTRIGDYAKAEYSYVDSSGNDFSSSSLAGIISHGDIYWSKVIGIPLKDLSVLIDET